jgi:nitrite reductase/ring-hydroxylating ferredoxin subunit
MSKANFPGILAVAVLAGLLAFATGCGKENSQPQIPDVPVNFVIDPNSTQYLELSHIGGSIYLTGGYRGILVYRYSLSEFMAFERACPYDFTLPAARVDVDTSLITCYCPACKSKYILTDGTPFQGPSRYALKQYATTYDGALLYVYN